MILKSLADAERTTGAVFALFGDPGPLRVIAERIGVAMDLPVVPLSRFSEFSEPASCVVETGGCSPPVCFGEVRAECGAAAVRYLRAAVDAVLSGSAGALCTAPVHKGALRMAGWAYPGHTELLSEWTRSPRALMSFALDDWWAVLATTHVSLREALLRVRRDLIEGVIEEAFRELGKYVRSVRMGVAAVNPHASEGGLFGAEEEEEIWPAVEACRRKGFPVSGPWPADTIFVRASRGEFNAVLSHYHDQALIPVKLFGIGRAVHVTLGLPFPRTSPDHGTAHDIAGDGIADSSGMLAALCMAARLATGENRQQISAGVAPVTR